MSTADDDITDEEAILITEAAIEKMQARVRARRIIDAAKLEFTRWRRRKRGIPTDSARCAAIMRRAEEVLMRQNESAKPFQPFARAPEATLLTEDAAETDRPLYPHSLPPDDGTLPGDAA
jgi:hypothetical protein